MRHARAAALLVPAIALALSACGAGGGAYCSTLTDNSDVSATVFTPVVPGMVTPEQVDERLDLLAQVEDDVPEELQEDFTVWQEFLEEAGPKLDSEEPEDLTSVITAADGEVDASRDALFEHYTGTCMD